MNIDDRILKLTELKPRHVRGVRGKMMFEFEVYDRHKAEYRENGRRLQVPLEPSWGPPGAGGTTVLVEYLKWLPPHENDPVTDADKVHVMKNLSSALIHLKICPEFL